MPDFYSTLEQFLNPTINMGGGPGGDEAARALAQLLLGGGSAALEGTPLFGNTFNAAVPTSPGSMTNLPPTLRDTIEQAGRIASGTGTPITGGERVLAGNPYGPGSYDPTNAQERLAVAAQGVNVQNINRARELLRSEALEDLPSPAKAEIVQRILDSIGIGGTGATNVTAQNVRAAASGIPIRGLSQEQAQRLLQQEHGEKIALSREQIAAKRNEPMMEKSAYWLNPQTGQPADPNMTFEEARTAGFVPVTQQNLNASATARAALEQLGEYESLIDKLKYPTLSAAGQKGELSARDLANVNYNAARVKAMRLAGNPDAKRLEALQGAIATLARATGDTANIAVQEREALKSTTLTDAESRESARAKVDQLRRILKGVMGARGIPTGEAPAGSAPAPTQGDKVLTPDLARDLRRRAGSAAAARQLAVQEGYTIPEQ